MNALARQLLLPSLCADALALGPHWIYEPTKISKLYPDGIRNYDAPRSTYHPAKSAGDFTHYGDQTLALLRSLVLRQGFFKDGWRDDWHQFWKNNPPAYRDGATKSTLGFLERSVDAASESSDLAGAARIAPIIALLAARPLSERIDAARAQTALTHGDRATIDAAEFFTRASDAIVSGSAIPAALEAAAHISYQALDARSFLDQAIAASDLNSNAAGDKFGLACNTQQAFPLTLWFLLSYSEHPLEALIANAMVGGDNAARGLPIGLLMGAAHGLAWLPNEWLDGLNRRVEIEALLTLAGISSEPATSHHTIPNPDGHTLSAVPPPASPVS